MAAKPTPKLCPCCWLSGTVFTSARVVILVNLQSVNYPGALQSATLDKHDFAKKLAGHGMLHNCGFRYSTGLHHVTDIRSDMCRLLVLVTFGASVCYGTMPLAVRCMSCTLESPCQSVHNCPAESHDGLCHPRLPPRTVNNS